jgi:hypothetical protein
MKPLRQNAVILTLFCALAIFTGCEHKKPVLIVPTQPPPAAAPSPSPTPEPAATQTEQQPQEPAAQPQTASPEQAKDEPEQQKKTKHGKKSSRHKPAAPAGEKSTSEVARNTGNKKIIPAEKAEPTPSPGPISAAPSSGQDQGSTEQLLQAAEANLNAIKRQLTKEEEIERAQVKEFITKSRNAITENDLARAHTWAVKAQLLSNELIKPR